MTTAIITTALAAEITAAIELRKSELEDSIRRYEDYITARREEVAKVEARMVEVFAVKARLEAAGFEVTYSTWTESLRVEIRQEQLPDAYRVLGRFDGRNAEKEIENARKKLLRITLTSVKYPFVRVTYVTKLPKAGAKCRIETVKYKARTEKRLVCEL